MRRRTLLARGLATGLAAGASALAFPAAAQENRSLRAIAQARDIVFGTAAATYELKDSDFVPLLVAQAAQLVPEYEMKRDVLEPAPGRYDFAALDRLFAFAAKNRLSMRGHPLVWYYANPPWLAPTLAARRDEQLLTGHVQTLLSRYRMASVDVVNEALVPPGEAGRADGFRDSLWLKAFGPGYIDLAFHAARAADPKVTLVYNDWGCEQGAPQNDRFRDLTLRLLDGLLKRGVPVDALGMQGHLSAFGNRVDQKKLAAFVKEIQARGLSLLVTELDVDDTGGAFDIAARDQAVADEARRFLDVVLDCPATRAVLTWSLSDRYVDPPDDWKLKLAGWRLRKTPYDAQMHRKPLWEAMARAFAGRRISY
jgi:endo-1,4-beta-xylanase